MAEWTDVDAQIMCHGLRMRPVHHEGQPIAEQVKRVYKCRRCGTERTIFVDVITREWRERG